MCITWSSEAGIYERDIRYRRRTSPCFKVIHKVIQTYCKIQFRKRLKINVGWEIWLTKVDFGMLEK